MPAPKDFRCVALIMDTFFLWKGSQGIVEMEINVYVCMYACMNGPSHQSIILIKMQWQYTALSESEDATDK